MSGEDALLLSQAPTPARHESLPIGTADLTDGQRDALMRIATAVAAATAIEDVVELAADVTHATLGQGSVSIGCFEGEPAHLRVLVNAGDLAPVEQRRPDDEVYPVEGSSSLARIVHTGTTQFTAVDDPDADAQVVAVLRGLGKESSVAVPIVAGGTVWGELWATTAPGAPRFRGPGMRFLEAVAGQLAALVQRAARFSDVSRLAYEDPLTGLANRRALEERLAAACERHAAGSTALTLLVCDVDNLKTINDGRGHHAGDRALRRVADALVAGSAAHPEVMVGRLSGDEFAVVLEGLTLEAAREVAGTTLRLLREDRDVPLSLSCGAAIAEHGPVAPDALLRAADTAQYASKRRGGGQLCTAESTDERHLDRGPRRRTRRRARGELLERRSGDLLARLDGDAAEQGTLDRLELVVKEVSDVVNAAAWTVSFSEHGSSVIASVVTADSRDTRLRGLRLGLEDDVYELSEFPVTAELVKRGAGAFVIDRYDRDADGAEAALLRELDFTQVLGAAVTDPDGCYLLEIYGDGATSPLAAAELRVQLLARAAVGRTAGTDARIAAREKRVRRLEAAGTLGERLAGLTTVKEIVEVAAEQLHRAFDLPVCAIDRLTDDGRLTLAAARGEAVERLAASGSWSQPATLGLLGRALRDRAPVVTGDVTSEPDYRLTPTTGATRSELCAPLWEGERLWGVLDLHSNRPDAFGPEDVRLVQAIADRVGAALRSVRLYDQLEVAYLETAEALVAALEAKDLDTADHSRSIAGDAEAVARALGFGPAERRMLRFGAAFHDIGKLGIPESILTKPGPLTGAERARIEQHTIIGDQILAPIAFLCEARPLVRHGHERWDGAGYPDGLAGEQIPLGARVIFACDAWDAMTTDRPYRAALTQTEAAIELRRCAGTQFDPVVVEALLAARGFARPRGAAAAAS